MLDPLSVYLHDPDPDVAAFARAVAAETRRGHRPPPPDDVRTGGTFCVSCAAAPMAETCHNCPRRTAARLGGIRELAAAVTT